MVKTDFLRMIAAHIGESPANFSSAVVQVIEANGGGGGGGGVSYASQLPMSATDATKTETAINNNKGQIDGLEISVGLLADDVSNVVADLDTNYTDTAGINTLLADYETTTHATSTYATQSALTATNGNVATNTADITLLKAQKGLLKLSNTTASLVLTTTPTLVNLPTTTLTLGTSITKTSNTLFTINKTGYYNLLTRLRGTQTGAGTDTICNIDVLKNGVIIQSVGITMVDISINTYNFVELALALNATDTLSFNVYVTGGGGITLSTATINPLASLTIQEA